MATKQKGSYWIDKAIFPFYLAYCPSPKAWHKTLKHLKLADEPWPEQSGRCTSFYDDGKPARILVTLNDHEERGIVSICGLLAHEATHAFEFLCVSIGEKEPSSEFRAYAIQWFTLSLLDAYCEAHGVKFPRQNRKDKTCATPKTK